MPTAFNLLGPMTNPAGVRRQVIGVADPTAAAKVAHVLHHLGTERAFVVHGDGVDELPLDGTGVVYDVSPAVCASGASTRRRLASGRARARSCAAATRPQNAAIIEGVLAGERGPRRDVVLLNAGAALLVSRTRRPRCATACELAAATIDSGAGRAHARPAARDAPVRAPHDGRRPARQSIVHEIAARRAADLDG